MAFILKFLFIIFLLGFLFREIFRFILPKVLNKYIKNLLDQQQNIYNQGKAGETTIKTQAKNKEDKLKDKGEYVDYEEIE